MSDKRNPFGDFDLGRWMESLRMPGIDMDALGAAYKRNMETLQAVQKSVAGHTQTAMTRQMASLNEAMQEFSEAAARLREAQGPEAFAREQTALVQNAMQRSLNQLREFGEEASAANREVMETLSRRFDESVAEIREAAERMSSRAKGK